MKTSDFMYDLPEERIAQTPIEPRDHSRMMVIPLDGSEIEHKHFYDVVNYLRPGDALVINETRVIPARLLGERENGGPAEILLLKQVGPKLWETLVKDFGPDRRTKGCYPQIAFANSFIGNYLRLDLLARYELKARLEEEMSGYFLYMADKTGTLWENDTDAASCNHGFASYAAVLLQKIAE